MANSQNETSGTSVVITGGAGFLGVELARRLLGAEHLVFAGRPAGKIALTVVDRVPPPADLTADPRVQTVQADLLDVLQHNGTPDTGAFRSADVVFHLAAAVSAESESDFDLGMRVNLLVLQRLLEVLRAAGRKPLTILASSLAVYGGTEACPLPETVSESTLPVPRSSYGTQKLLSEYLIADYSRKGFLRGRNVRLMTVSVRPGQPNRAASGFLSGVIREPLAGIRAVCPVPPDTVVGLSSPSRTINGLLRVAELTAAEWADRHALNLPALTVSIRDMVAALEEEAGPATAGLIDWIPDPQTADLVSSWPAHFDNSAANAFGLFADPDFRAIIAEYRAD